MRSFQPTEDSSCPDDTFLQFSCERADVSRCFGLRSAMFGLMAAMFVFQTELSDGIAVLVASNDHIQDLISQMEELCQTIEVSWWWGLMTDRTPDPWPLFSGEWKAAAGTAGRPFWAAAGQPGGAEAGAGGAHQQGAGPQAETSAIAPLLLRRGAGGCRGAGGVGHPLYGGAVHGCLYPGRSSWWPG